MSKTAEFTEMHEMTSCLRSKVRKPRTSFSMSERICCDSAAKAIAALEYSQQVVSLLFSVYCWRSESRKRSCALVKAVTALSRSVIWGETSVSAETY